jgi:hypothetical protein
MAWWDWVPKNDDKDPFRNRRNMAYILLFYTLIVTQEIIALVWYKDIEASVITALLAVQTAIFAFVAKLYFDACNKDK